MLTLSVLGHIELADRLLQQAMKEGLTINNKERFALIAGSKLNELKEHECGQAEARLKALLTKYNILQRTDETKIEV